MSKGSFGTPKHKGGLGRRHTSVAVIQHNVQYSYLRTAKITFYVVLAVVGLFAAVISTYYLHPLAAVPIGLVAGTIVGGLVAAVIAIWPVLRAIWWWLPEITFALLLVDGWVYLQDWTNPIITGVIYASIIAACGLIPFLRRYVLALAWCLIVRHRLRVCFASFLSADRHGHLPFIGVAKPIPVGERVWLWLRPGLSLEQLESQLGRIAVACWAASVTVTKARTSNAAVIYLDIKRRDVLGGLVGSPLTEELPTDVPAIIRPVPTLPAQLDLADVPDVDDTDPTERPAKKTGRAPAVNGTPAKTTPDNPDLDWI
ncbi:hypothetical protein [Planomonospora venezuelensis]|uniref:Uncharacterized protein n=1 Tax=Planomonospora venezuelensis TaxID=1999 RepID=A0A841DCT7_PLAVE|nr:hypothetical protein [Planomonospora venezuelensis]MBB5967880.1 hypothetical protein [Planomonospora venezuelensis]GIN03280.1 hypothetical protein Pve01_49380 [Planomonospora venezuelensis]